MKKCPFCAEEIQNEAVKCKHCGEMLTRASAGNIVGYGGSPFLRIVGLLILLAGVASLVYYYTMFETSVEVPTQEILGQTIGGGRVNNIGLMQDKQNGLFMGAIGSAVGLLLMYVGRARE